MNLKRKATYLIPILFVLISCTKEAPEPSPNFNIFGSANLKFEYFYTFLYYREDVEHSQINELDLCFNNGVKLNNRDYYGFFYCGNEQIPVFGIPEQKGLLNYNFLPIRFENGNYYELRRDREVLILKDNIKLGDAWTTIIENGENEISYAFEVVEEISCFNEAGVEFRDVLKIRESLKFGNPPVYTPMVSYHYYNKESGIVRREIPVYQSGTYAHMTFNRIK